MRLALSILLVAALLVAYVWWLRGRRVVEASPAVARLVKSFPSIHIRGTDRELRTSMAAGESVRAIDRPTEWMAHSSEGGPHIRGEACATDGCFPISEAERDAMVGRANSVAWPTVRRTVTAAEYLEFWRSRGVDPWQAAAVQRVPLVIQTADPSSFELLNPEVLNGRGVLVIPPSMAWHRGT